MKLGIYQKVLALVGCLCIAFPWAFGTYYVRQHVQMLNRQLDERAAVLVNYLAYNCEYPVLINDKAALSRLVKGTLAQRDVVYSRIEKKDGTVLFQDGSPAGPVKEYTAKIVTRKSSKGPGEELILGMPVSAEEELGEVRLAVSLRELGDEAAKIRNVAAFAALVSGAGASFFMYLLLRRILGRPIAELVGATQMISNGDFGHRVPVRTRDEIGDLAASFNKMTESLREAQEELVRKEKLSILGQLAGSVGHELRNPLGVITNAVYYLKTVLPADNEPVREYLGIIRNEVATAERIITDLLDFARARTPQVLSIPVNTLITQSLAKCTLPDRISLQVVIPDTLPLVSVDPLQLEQVLQNLITNAVQAMPQGGVLRVSALFMPDKGGVTSDADAASPVVPAAEAHGRLSCIAISVTDTGPGIAPENMKKIFQPLFTTKAKGIGLGLVVSKRLAEANGCRIEVDNVPGAGAVFTVLIPAEA